MHDSGIGIAPEALARLFHAFERADSSTARRYGGTGLGLAICRQLVELMGGPIGAVSELGVGSCFSFVLPLADGVAPALAPPAPRAPHSHRLKVLCAEDDPTNQIIIRMMLEELGHEVDIADNGQKAVVACACSRYDLTLMDGRMPELDGASATRLIRAGGPAEASVQDCAMMIIAFTANASEEDRARYLACGMDDFLSKPIDEAALHAQLSCAIARQLARGMVLAPMAAQVSQLPQLPQVPGSAELDALFGVPAEPALASMRIVLASSANDQASLAQASSLGVDGYLLKPFGLAQVSDQLARLAVLERETERALATMRRLGISGARLLVYLGGLESEREIAPQPAIGMQTVDAASFSFARIDRLCAGCATLGLEDAAARRKVLAPGLLDAPWCWPCWPAHWPPSGSRARVSAGCRRRPDSTPVLKCHPHCITVGHLARTRPDDAWPPWAHY